MIEGLLEQCARFPLVRHARLRRRGLTPLPPGGAGLAPAEVVLIHLSGVHYRSRTRKIAATLRQAGHSLAYFTKLAPVDSGRGVWTGRLPEGPVLHFPDAHAFLPVGRPRVAALNWSFMIDYLRAAMWPLIRELRPRVIHTFDSAAIGLGHEFRDKLSAEGTATAWIHDFTEYAAGHSFRDDRLPDAPPDDDWRTTVLAHERAHAVAPDHAFTVSPALAERLVGDYALARRPTVLLNVPRRADFDPELQPTVRARLKLPAEVPLLVYSGGVTPLRGLHTLVAAVGRLPGAHLAIVTRARTRYVRSLRAVAKSRGFAERLHFLPYVEPHQVASFLRDADVGVHPLVHYANAEVSLPNKLFDYLHAGLPVVVSDCKAMADFVRERGAGEIFRAEDAGSLTAALERALSRPRGGRRAPSLEGLCWEDYAEALLDGYRAVLGGESGDRSLPES